MCQFASFVLTKDQAFWLDFDSHEKVISHYNLQHLDKHPIGLVRVEVIPPETSVDNLDSWEFQVDQDVYPDWTYRGDPSLESRTREALRKRSVEEKWFEIVTGQNVTVSKFGNATAGDHGIASADYGGKAFAGDGGNVTVGDYGLASVGYNGNATAGDHGTATAGDGGIATAGYNGTATAGDFGTASVGIWGTSTAGVDGYASAGENGTATAGKYGTAIAGVSGTASAGKGGTAIAGTYGTASAGVDGTIIVQWFDQASRKIKTLVGSIGEGGLEPNTKYRVENGAWVKVD